jgi:SulP family sulfate permease
LNARLAARLEPARRWLAGESVFFARPAAVLRGYDRAANLKPDLLAGLAVAVVLLPQAIAFATLAELPPQMGLYTGVVAAIVGALWGSSRLLQTGPTNTSSMLIFATLLIAATPGTEDYMRAAGYLAVMVGLLRLAMGLLRLGVLVHFVADSVIVGFTAGAGVLIMINEMRHVLRLEIPSVPELGLTVRMILLRIEFVHWPSVALALGAFLVALVLKRGGPRMPGAFVAMAAAGVATALLDLDSHGVQVLGAIPRSLPPLAHLPVLDMALIWRLAPGAVAVAAIGLVESISMARAIAARDGDRLDVNQEFVGQGLASVASGMFTGFACTGSWLRSATNREAGGRTPVAAASSGLWLLLIVLAGAPLAAYLPRAALAGILILTAGSLIDRREMARVIRTSRGDTSIMVATFVSALTMPLQFAILAGVLVSFGRFLLKTSTPGVHAVVPDENFRHFVRVEGQPSCPQLGVVEIEGPLYFGAVNHVEDAIRANLEANPQQKYLLLRMHMVDHCDVSGLHMLESILRLYRRRGGDMFLEGVRPDVRRMSALSGFNAVLGAGNMLDEENAISHLFHKVLNPGYCVYECPERVFGECQAIPKDPHAARLPDYEHLPERAPAELAPSDLRARLDRPEGGALVIDVGEPGEFRNWHIPQARNVPLRLLATEGAFLPRDRALVFVSRIGRRSLLGAGIMQDLGHPEVYTLRGGMLAWEAAGFPIAVE